MPITENVLFLAHILLFIRVVFFRCSEREDKGEGIGVGVDTGIGVGVGVGA